MKIFFVWLLMMHDGTGTHIPTAFVQESVCRITADELNARAGDKRNMRWTCERQGVEK